MATLTAYGRTHEGRTAETIVRRLFGRKAFVVWAGDRNNPRPVMAARRDKHGTHVLGEFVHRE